MFLLNKFLQHNRKKLVAQVYGQQTEKIESIEQLQINIKVNSPVPSCDTCDGAENLDTAMLTAVTATDNQPCDITVTPVTASPEDSTIAIEDPHNDNYEPVVGDEVRITSALIASRIGECHIIAGILSNKGIQIKYMQNNVAGKKEEKIANIGRDEYTPAIKQAT